MQSLPQSRLTASSVAPSRVFISGTRSCERNDTSWRMIAAWISPFRATAVMASSTLVTTSSSNWTSSDWDRRPRSASARQSGPVLGESSASNTV